MVIHLEKFGKILVSRPAGKEAWAAFQPILRGIKNDETMDVDFTGVEVLTPSWADEFLTPLMKNYKKVTLKNTGNATVKARLETLKITSWHHL